MFNNLSDRLSGALNKLRGVGRLTEDNIKESVAEVRRALLEADVALPVITEFTEQIKAKAVGQEVIKSVRPGDAFIKLVQDELIHILGDQAVELNLKAQRPAIILMAGLQGSGKTTTVAKLAKLLHEQHDKNVLVVSTDVYRPAAIDQLETLASQVDAEFFPSTPQEKPLHIAKKSLDYAKTQLIDVVIIDTAGRLHIDDDLMHELSEISSAIRPTETLLVVDSMMGQDAATVAKTFNERLEISGIILTKTDGDARGGAALSMRMITGKPIKFVGVGEKIGALEPFYPQRIASRILGMGDIIGLVEEAQRKVDKKEVDKIAQKLKKGKRFDFNDFLSQLQQMKKMGGIKSLMSKMPGMGQVPAKAQAMMDESLFVKMEAIINSMTKKERKFPALLNGSRKRRIAMGSGTNLQDINKLLKQFTQMQKMLSRFKGDKMAKRMQQLKGQLPPDLLGKLPSDLF